MLICKTRPHLSDPIIRVDGLFHIIAFSARILRLPFHAASMRFALMVGDRRLLLQGRCNLRLVIFVKGL